MNVIASEPVLSEAEGAKQSIFSLRFYRRS